MSSELRQLASLVAALKAAAHASSPSGDGSGTTAPSTNKRTGQADGSVKGGVVPVGEHEGSVNYDAFLRDITKKVTDAVLATTAAARSGHGTGSTGSTGGGSSSSNTGYAATREAALAQQRQLEGLLQRMDAKLADAKDLTAADLAKLKKELLDQLKLRLELALRDLRLEIGLALPDSDDTTAIGTKPVMCIACSRPVAISTAIRDAAIYPTPDMLAELGQASVASDYVSFVTWI